MLLSRDIMTIEIECRSSCSGIKQTPIRRLFSFWGSKGQSPSPRVPRSAEPYGVLMSGKDLTKREKCDILNVTRGARIVRHRLVPTLSGR